MRVCVKLFARAKDLAGTSELAVDLPDGAAVADLRRLLALDRPALAGLLTRSGVAVNGDFAADVVRIPEGAEIALLPPVSGGAR